jgi:hypothetical protein
MAKHQQPKTTRLQQWRERRRRANTERAGRIHGLRTAEKLERSRGHNWAGRDIGPSGNVGGMF